MRADFFLLDGETNASSYHRVLQYLPFLRAAGIAPRVRRPVPERIYQRLMEHGRGTPSEKARFYALFLATRLRDVLAARSAEVAVIQRDLFPFGPPTLERLLHRTCSSVVYDTDDATYLRPSFTPDTVFQRLRRFDKVAEVVATARWVSAASEPIAAWAREFNAHVSVIPMAVDLAAYERASRPTVEGAGPVVLGRAGTAGGVRYLEALGPVLQRVAARHDVVVRVISGGYANVRLPGVPLDARPWCAESALSDLAEFDIGLVPLADTSFEHAKFPFKLLQYLALGVPSVSARVGLATSLIRDGDNGLLAHSDAEWLAALERLIGDVSLRARLRQAGRATVAASYTTERVAPLLVDGLLRAAR
jgi:glycosyltransferase involved in cell wall biosynthesis